MEIKLCNKKFKKISLKFLNDYYILNNNYFQKFVESVLLLMSTFKINYSFWIIIQKFT